MIFGYLTEDLRAARLLRSHERLGFHVDVGCSEPTQVSNTRLLCERGWRRIKFDANRSVVEKCRRTRPRDHNRETFVGLNAGLRDFLVFEDETRATASIAFQERWERQGAIREVLHTVPKSLTAVVDGACAPSAMHFLNIDVEGLEREVLQSLDCEKCRFGLIAAGTYGLELPDAASHDVVRFLAGAGYALVAYNGLTNFFVARQGLLH